MSSFVQSVYLDSEPGIPMDLEPAGTSLENPYVYDSAARELKTMAGQGLVEITNEQLKADAGTGTLISRISFKRLR